MNLFHRPPLPVNHPNSSVVQIVVVQVVGYWCCVDCRNLLAAGNQLSTMMPNYHAPMSHLDLDELVDNWMPLADIG